MKDMNGREISLSDLIEELKNVEAPCPDDPFKKAVSGEIKIKGVTK